MKKMKRFEFRVTESDWIYVKEKGLPDDGDWCLLVCDYRKNGSYTYEMGGYNESSHSFYSNFGFGGMVIDDEAVVAWVKIFAGDNFLKVIDDLSER